MADPAPVPGQADLLLAPEQVAGLPVGTIQGPVSAVASKKQKQLLVGEKRNSPHVSRDWFRTPAWATNALLEREVFPGVVWECAAGDGMMVDPLKQAGYAVYASDIQPMREDVVDLDFLDAHVLPEGVRSIVTNPPFKIATELVLHALSLGVRKVAVFQRMAFREGVARHQTLFGPHPPSRVWNFSRRVTCWAGDAEKQQTDGGTVAYSWFVWEKFHRPGPDGWIV